MSHSLPRAGDFTPEVVEILDVPRLADGLVDLDGVVARLAPADLLESAAGSGWSYVVPHSGAVLRDDGVNALLRRRDGADVELGGDPFRAIDDVAGIMGASPTAARDPVSPPFTGGLVGALAYDLGRRIETIPSRTPRLPPAMDVCLRTTDTVVAIPPSRTYALISARESVFETGTPTARIEGLRARLRTPVAALGTFTQRPQRLGTTLPAGAYRSAVARILAAIGRGDVFQVNLSQRIHGRFDADTFALYRALRTHSPAPFGASLPGIGVASVSPEAFLGVDSGHVQTRPVKGTRRRDPDAALDAALADDLATSPKDRAENVMVVDMERNDLGRVCRPGSVVVPELTRVEAHPTVWHLVSTVRGELSHGVGYGDLLRATFPCGSITGAPKIAAMRMIEELEPVRRGWYCGGIGFLGAGLASLSVAIRTATLRPDGVVTYGAGGGIVADSDPHAEYLESLDKAVAFLRAVHGIAVGSDRAHRWAP